MNKRARIAFDFAACLGPLAVYVWTACPTMHWLDASEFAAASADLGIAHPPGHPLTLLLGRAFQLLLPFGSLAFRTNIASAVAAAAAAWVLFRICLLAMQRMEAAGRNDGVHASIALAATWLWAFSGSTWMQAVRAEVYALQALLGFLVVYQTLLWRAGDGNALGRAAFVLGLGLGNHHLLAILLAVAVAVWLVIARGWSAVRRDILRAMPFGLLGAAIVLYLPIRALAEPEINWGDPDTLGNFWWVISGRPFQRTVGVTIADPLTVRLTDLTFTLAGQIGLLTATMALGGLWLMVRTPAARATCLLWLFCIATNLLAPALVGFDPNNPDAHGYALLTLGGVAVLACVFIHALVQGVSAAAPSARSFARALALVTPLCASTQVLAHHEEGNLSDAWGADEFTRALLDTVPGGGALVTYDFRTVFNLWYARQGEGARPDIRHVHAGFLGFPGYATEQRLAALRDPNAFCEYHESISPAQRPQGRGLVPAGLLLKPRSPDPSVSATEEHRRRRERLLARLAPLPADLQTEHALLWWHFQAAQYFCGMGDKAGAAKELADARIYSKSPLLDDLARDCGLESH